MASTRNKNTTSAYRLQQNEFNKSLNYIEFKNGFSGAAFNQAIPTVGIMPSKMPRDAFSHNSVDIESALFGINSTNLVQKQTPIIPSLKPLPEVSFFTRMHMVMPNPLVVEKNQRPFPHSN
jgi:hypothetical protein